MRLAVIAALFALPLAGCDNDKPGTSISIDASDDHGNTVAHVDGNTGTVSINTPGFTGSLKLPRIQLSADNFDMNGVHLYPGSTISGINVDARGGKGADDDSDGIVHVRFDSPAAPGVVRDWLAERLNKAGYRVAPAGSGLAGTTDENKPFRLELVPAANGHASGTITMGS